MRETKTQKLNRVRFQKSIKEKLCIYCQDKIIKRNYGGANFCFGKYIA